MNPYLAPSLMAAKNRGCYVPLLKITPPIIIFPIGLEMPIKFNLTFKDGSAGLLFLHLHNTSKLI